MNLSGKDSFKPKGKRLHYLHYQFNISRASFTLEYMPSARQRGSQQREVANNVCFSLKLLALVTAVVFLPKFCKI